MLHHAGRDTMTAREREEYDQQRELFNLQSSHTLKVKELELKLAKTEMKWQQIYKIPTLIIKLPLLIILSVGFIAAMARGKDPGDKFWDLFK